MARSTSGGKYYSFGGLCVMVADDNRFVRSILVTVLKGLGIGKIMQAENGEEAQAILDVSAQMQGDTRDVDIVFADHLMSPGDGIDFLKWVRGHESDKVRFLPIVMMSGEADMKSVTAARDAGVTEYLAKPMSVINVASRLLAIIDKPRNFVRAPGYFGPDRRRQTLSYEFPDKRQMRPEDMKIVDEGSHMVVDMSNPAEPVDPGGPELPAGQEAQNG
jgi:two-component system, chemotaxis family, chemotaxis protein CheY